MPTYQLFGLVVSSELVLPGLPLEDADAADVLIRFGEVARPASDTPGYHIVGPGHAILVVPDVGRYAITAAREITIQPAPGASDRNVRVFLLGSAIGALLHQRGLFPLHANAVLLDGKAFALMGPSGAGKSTLAAWFLDRGHPILTDDVCVISWDDAGRPIAHRGLLRLRLWREALERSGRHALEEARSFDDQDKFDVAVPDGREAPPTAPLGGIVLLARSDTDAFVATRLAGITAIDALMSNTYRGGFAELGGQTAPTLAHCVRLARQVPVLEVTRAWSIARYDIEAARLEQLLREI